MEPSNDPVLQSRLFAYPDAQRYRLGQNYKSIPVNCPYATSNYHRSGAATTDANGGSAPNYPSSAEPMKYAERPYTLAQIADKHEGPGVILTTSEIANIDFEQPRCVCTEGQVARLRSVLTVSILLLFARPPASSGSASLTTVRASVSSRYVGHSLDAPCARRLTGAGCFFLRTSLATWVPSLDPTLSTVSSSTSRASRPTSAAG